MFFLPTSTSEMGLNRELDLTKAMIWPREYKQVREGAWNWGWYVTEFKAG